MPLPGQKDQKVARTESYSGKILVKRRKFNVFFRRIFAFGFIFGDDDVYLFINDELVMDLGAAHGLDGYRFELNDYVNAAKAEVKEEPAAETDAE